MKNPKLVRFKPRQFWALEHDGTNTKEAESFLGEQFANFLRPIPKSSESENEDQKSLPIGFFLKGEKGEIVFVNEKDFKEQLEDAI